MSSGEAVCTMHALRLLCCNVSVKQGVSAWAQGPPDDPYWAGRGQNHGPLEVPKEKRCYRALIKCVGLWEHSLKPANEPPLCAKTDAWWCFKEKAAGDSGSRCSDVSILALWCMNVWKCASAILQLSALPLQCGWCTVHRNLLTVCPLFSCSRGPVQDQQLEDVRVDYSPCRRWSFARIGVMKSWWLLISHKKASTYWGLWVRYCTQFLRPFCGLGDLIKSVAPQKLK